MNVNEIDNAKTLVFPAFTVPATRLQSCRRSQASPPIHVAQIDYKAFPDT
jgi:hypothetical protein